MISCFQFECVATLKVVKTINNLALRTGPGHGGIYARFAKRILESSTSLLIHILKNPLYFFSEPS